MPVSPSLAPAQQHIIRNELKLQFIWELFAITPFILLQNIVIYNLFFTKPCIPNQTFMRLWKFLFFFFHTISWWFIPCRPQAVILYSILPPHRNLLLVFMWLRRNILSNHEFKTTIKCFKLYVLCIQRTYIYT